MTQSDHTSAHPAVFLHIGTMKSGTTYLQQRLTANRPTLAAHGVNWPGERWGHQVKAVKGLLAWSPRGKAPRLWDRTAASMVAHDGTSILSMEFLFVATPAQIDHAVSSLAGADLHVVLTLRDATSAAPSQWQTGVRSGMKLSWADYAPKMSLVGRAAPRLVARIPRARAARHFVLRQSAELVLGPWLEHIPADHFHTVLVPKSREDPDLLWKRFAEAVSISPECAPHRPEFARQSLGYASASLVGRVNERFGNTKSPAYRAVVRRFLCEKVLTPLAASETPIPLTRQVYLAGIRQNVRNRKALLESGVPVIGDLDDLPITPDRARLDSLPTRVEAPSEAEYLAAAETAVTALVARAAQLKGGSTPGTASGLVGSWRAEPDPMEAATDAVVKAVRSSVRAVRRRRASGEQDVRLGRAED